MIEEIKIIDEAPAPEFDIYQPANIKLDIAGTSADIWLTVKTWGKTFANRPMVLVLTKDTAADLVKRLQKSIDHGPV